ncbi:MAG TPA: TraX family protein [Bacilli bacterium]|nr:TraX family protein [Bacilli bacterium]
MNKPRFSLNSSHLKILAMIIILIDHLGLFFVSPYGNTESLYFIMRGIGRLGFPLYAFFIVEGVIYTRNIKSYLLKLLGLTLLITGVQAILLYTPLNQLYTLDAAFNIFLTLFTGAATVAYFHLKKYRHVYLLIPLVLMMTTNVLAIFIKGDWQMVFVNEYGIYGIITILGFYLARRLTPTVQANLISNNQVSRPSLTSAEYTQKTNNYLSCISLLFINLVWYILSITSELVPFDGFQSYALFTGILLLMYNGKRGYQPIWFRWVYYLYYPLHLGLLAVISILIS